MRNKILGAGRRDALKQVPPAKLAYVCAYSLRNQCSRLSEIGALSPRLHYTKLSLDLCQ